MLHVAILPAWKVRLHILAGDLFKACRALEKKILNAFTFNVKPRGARIDVVAGTMCMMLSVEVDFWICRNVCTYPLRVSTAILSQQCTATLQPQKDKASATRVLGLGTRRASYLPE